MLSMARWPSTKGSTRHPSRTGKSSGAHQAPLGIGCVSRASTLSSSSPHQRIARRCRWGMPLQRGQRSAKRQLERESAAQPLDYHQLDDHDYDEHENERAHAPRHATFAARPDAANAAVHLTLLSGRMAQALSLADSALAHVRLDSRIHPGGEPAERIFQQVAHGFLMGEPGDRSAVDLTTLHRALQHKERTLALDNYGTTITAGSAPVKAPAAAPTPD